MVSGIPVSGTFVVDMIEAFELALIAPPKLSRLKPSEAAVRLHGSRVVPQVDIGELAQLSTRPSHLLE